MTTEDPIAELISPEGERVSVYRIKAFCRDNQLDSGNLCRVINGERQHHRGWRSAEHEPAYFRNRKPYGVTFVDPRS